jgi:hypothetical protein
MRKKMKKFQEFPIAWVYLKEKDQKKIDNFTESFLKNEFFKSGLSGKKQTGKYKKAKKKIMRIVEKMKKNSEF